MEVVIVGGGAIGLLIGSFLTESKIAVTMLVRREEQKNIIEQKGICRLNEDGTETVNLVRATTNRQVLKDAKMIVIAVKYRHLHELLEELILNDVQSPLLFVQNGIGHLEIVREVDFPIVSLATVEHGAFKMDDRTIRHNGIGALTIGKRFGDIRAFESIRKANQPKFPIAIHMNAEEILMRKVLINCMINPLTAILGIKNGELLSNKTCYILFKELYEELMSAFPGMQVELSLEYIEVVCKKTKNNQSSMLADRLANRPMEIETIVTAVIRKAQLKNKQLPLLSMLEKLLYAIDEKEK